MTERELQIQRGEVSRREDRLGLICDEVHTKVEGALQRVLASGYYSFLYDLLDLPNASSLIYLDLFPGTITVFDHGETRHTEGLTNLSRSLIDQIAAGRGSKKQLIEKIWMAFSSRDLEYMDFALIAPL